MSGISHKQAIQLIHRRLDGLLNQKQSLSLDEHLQSCEECSAYASEMDLLPAHLHHDFHAHWDAYDGPSKHMTANVLSQSRRTIMSNRINAGLKIFAGFMALILLGFLFTSIFEQLQEYSKKNNPTSGPALSGAEANPTPATSLLTVQEAEALAGFDVLVPSYLPEGYAFQGAAYDPQSQEVTLKYISSPGDSMRIGMISIYQRRGDFPKGPEPPPYATPVPVGDVTGKFTHGVWVYDSANITTPRWEGDNEYYALSWQKDGISFIVDFLGGVSSPLIQLDGLTAIAESLKSAPDNLVTNQEPPPTSSKISSYDGLIAFTSDQSGDFDIYSMHADGSGLTNLTNNPADDSSPFWSPDGKRIAFESNRNGNADIYVMNFDGSNVTHLTDDTAQDTHPVWSPDGTKIAYASGDPSKNNTNIYVMDANGQNQHQLTNYVPNTAVWPEVWSPDSQSIFFEVSRQIVKVNLNDGEIKPITPQKDENIPSNFVLSKDGSILMYLATCNPNEIDSSEFCTLVKSIQVNGENEETRATLKTPKICPLKQTSTWMGNFIKWSPDQTKLLFAFTCEDNGWLYIANVDSADIKPLTNYPILGNMPDNEAVTFDWSPDSQSIVFMAALDKPENLYILNVNNALQNPELRPTPLNASAPQISSPAWQPNLTEDLVEQKPTPAVTSLPSSKSDNRLIAFTSDQNGNLDIYTMRPDGRELTNLTNNPARDTNPIWSPDGKRIAFESDRTGLTQIYLADANGSNVIQITKDNIDHRLPLNIDGKTNPWSPDGNKLLFLQEESKDKTWTLFSMDISSENKAKLASGRIQFNNISWSPDGKYIGYVVNDSSTPDETFMPSINIVKADGTQNFAIKELLLSKESLNYPFYYWSQDGGSIFFTAYKHIDEGQDRWIAYEASVPKGTLIEKATSSTQMQDWWNGTSFIIGNVPGSPLTWLRSDKTYSTLYPLENCEIADPTIELHYGLFPRRSSNGDQIIVVTCPNNNLLFYYTNSDGTIIKQLLRFPASAGKENNIINIIWSPDGKFVAFKLTSPERNSMYILNVSEALNNPSVQPLQIPLDEASLQYEPSWQPLP